LAQARGDVGNLLGLIREPVALPTPYVLRLAQLDIIAGNNLVAIVDRLAQGSDLGGHLQDLAMLPADRGGRFLASRATWW